VRPLKIKFAKGTPIAGVFAGTQYATATVSSLESQSTEIETETVSQIRNMAIEIKTMKMIFDDLREVNTSEPKAASYACQMMRRRQSELSLLSFHVPKTLRMGFGKKC
jgi:hypothetical protein